MTELSKPYSYFINLGDNCEFGFAQRHHQVDAGALLRWSIVPPEALIHCLKNRFASLYEFDNLVPFAIDMVFDQATKLAFHSEMRSENSEIGLTFVDLPEQRRAIYAQEIQKIEHMRRKLLGQLEEGKFIFVYKKNSGLDLKFYSELSAALLAYNQNNTLLVVEQGATKSASIIKLSASLYIGTIEKFAAYEAANQIKQESWDFLVRQLVRMCMLDDARSLGEADKVELIAQQAADWSRGIGHELWFWSRWFETRGLEWTHDFAQRLDGQQPLVPELRNLLPVRTVGPARILDVGSGPMTNIGFTHETVALDVAACDPLADYYAAVAERYGIKRPLPTQFAVAEDLSAYFDENSFDIVNCCNALDHSADPVRGITEMLRVLKKNGYIHLKHHLNEAETENYEGFHQFNFDMKNDRFVIWNKQEYLDVISVLPIRVEISVRLEAPDIIVVIKKVEDFDPALRLVQSKNRLRHIQRAFITHQTQQAEAELKPN